MKRKRRKAGKGYMCEGGRPKTSRHQWMYKRAARFMHSTNIY